MNWRDSVNREVDVEILEESALARAQSIIQSAMDKAGMSRADLAREMKRNRSFVSRMLSGDHNLTVKTMTRALVACGVEVDFKTVPIVWNWESAPVSASVHDGEEMLPAYSGSAPCSVWDDNTPSLPEAMAA